jgi:hypothetical protein
MMTFNGDVKPFLGKGWRFPWGKQPGVNGRGGLALGSYEDDIEDAIRIILSTAQGERVMRPEFGSAIHELVFAPNDASTAGLLVHYTEAALKRWEPRIGITRVNAQPDPLEPHKMMITINYVVKATNDEVNLVYPFYLIPSQE